MPSPATAPTPAVVDAEPEPFTYAVALHRDGEQISATIDVLTESADDVIDAAAVDDLAPAFWVMAKRIIETYQLDTENLPPVTITEVRPVLQLADDAREVGFTVVVDAFPPHGQSPTIKLDSATQLHDLEALRVAVAVLRAATGHLYQLFR